MKKMYVKPQTTAVRVDIESSILQLSVDGRQGFGQLIKQRSDLHEDDSYGVYDDACENYIEHDWKKAAEIAK